jgi:hypothetical protein
MSRSRTHHLHSVGNLLVADLDEQTFGFVHPRSVPLIQSPLNTDNESEKSSVDLKGPRSTIAPTENDGSPPSSHHHNHHHHNHHRATLEPSLNYHHESSTIQLFYDLFFVANLTNYTNKHEVTDSGSKSLQKACGSSHVL